MPHQHTFIVSTQRWLARCLSALFLFFDALQFLATLFFALPLVLSLPYLLAPVSLFIIDAFLSAALSQKPKESDIGWI